MKNKIFTGAISMLLFLSACNTERTPWDGAVTDEVVTTETGLEQILNGVYNKLRSTTRSGWGGIMLNTYRNGSFGADEVALSGTTTDPMMSFNDLVRNPFNRRTNVFWLDGFSIVYVTNTIMENLQEGRSIKLDHMLGEAYYLRAYANLSMLMTYSRPYSHGQNNLGIPLKKTSSESDIPMRSTVGEGYNSVVEDLLKAEKLMANDQKNNIRVTQAAAQALLSRVYLYMENNTLAVQYADKVINTGRYTLVSTAELPNYAQKVPEQNIETIFALRYEQNVNYEGWYTLGSMYATINGIGWGEIYASDPYIRHIQMFPSDVRNQFIQPDYLLTNGQKTPTVYWTVFNQQNKTYIYQIYNAQKNASGNTTFAVNGETYTVETEQLEYGGANYKRDYAMINGQKQYLKQDFQMNSRNGYPKYFVNKLSLQEGVAHLYSPIVSRLAEMYLIKAEAYAKQGNNAGALQNINTIRNRAGAPQFTSIPNGKTALDMVLEERWLEFTFEGHRKFDLVRNKRSINRQFPGVHLSQTKTKQIIDPDDNDLVFFIPQEEIQRVPNLQQNP